MADDNQYDIEEAIRRQKAAEAQVAGNAQSEWRDGYTLHAEAFLKSLAPEQTFIGEDLRRYVEPFIGQPHHFNAWSAMAGKMIRAWVKEKRIVRLGTMSQATRKTSHASLYPQYEVLP
jgi:hypothetical protein